MSFFKRLSLVALLLIIIGSMAIWQLFECVSATPEDSVQMFPGTYSHTLGTPAEIVKLDYPKSSIIQNTTGDIFLNITLTGVRSSIAIYIPPEFSFLQPDTMSIWTDITNDYKRVSLIKLGSSDPIAPDWWRVRIVNSTIPSGSHAVRMFNIKAPDVCGRYFLKVFIDGKSIGSENFPTVVVEGDLDPAYISGHVLYGGGLEYGYRYGLPVNVSGKVMASGTTPLGRAVKAQAYFNASANGCYTLYGLAAGTYELTASAAGFPPVTLDQMITVTAGQSLDGVDIYVYPGAQVSGTVWSKECGGLSKIPWGANYSISISLYDLNWGLLSRVDGFVNASRDNYNFTFGASPYWLVNMDFTGHIPQDYADYVSGLEAGIYYLNATLFAYNVTVSAYNATVSGYIQMYIFTVVVPSLQYTGAVHVEMDLWKCMAPYTPPSEPIYYGNLNITIYSVDCQSPPQRIPWAYPSMIRVHVYTIAAALVKTYIFNVPSVGDRISFQVTMLDTGVYTVMAFTPGYVQLDFPEVAVTANSTSDISLNLVKGGVIYTTINFKTEDLLAPISLTNYTPIRIEVYDAAGKFVGASIGYVPPGLDQVSWPACSFTRIIGFNSYAGNPCSRNYGNWVNYYDTTDGVPLLDNGLPAGSYTIKAWVPGYIQRIVVTATVDLCGAATVIFDLHRLSHIYGKVTGYNMFGELIPLSWATVSAYGPLLVTTSSLDGFYEMWLENGTYQVAAALLAYEAQVTKIRASVASETCVNFVLRRLGASIPELSATEPTLLAVLILAYALLHGKKPPMDSSFRRPVAASGKPERAASI